MGWVKGLKPEVYAYDERKNELELETQRVSELEGKRKTRSEK